MKKLPAGWDFAESGKFTMGFNGGNRSFPDRFAKISFGSGFFEIAGRDQVYSRTRVLPSSSWIFSGCHIGIVRKWLWG
mgnify:CR=1 FL=1|jgi:hypothetical protein